MTLAAAGLLSCTGTGQSVFDPASVADASGEVTRVEPLSWWTGMQTPLQLLVNGAGIAAYDVRIEGGQGVGVKARHKADSPNYLFVDVKVKPDAEPGTYYLVFSQGERQFKVPYEIAARAEGSAARKSFTTADMIYLLMPDRFANGDASNDSTPHTRERADRSAFFGRHGGDLQGMIDHLDYIAGLGATAVWPTPLLLDDEPEGSYHGYACGDYYRIDPRFGSNELYREFVGKAHEHGLKVIMDIVTNHCGTGHWWMKDLPFRDWIHQFPEYTGTNVCFSTNMDPNASRYDLDLQESGWFVPSMPDMNLDNPYLLQYFKQWAVWWIEYADLDGPLQREGADERVVRGRTQGILRFQHRGRMLDVVDPATGILAGRQSQQGRLRLAPAVDHGFPAAGGHLPGAAHRLAPLGRGHDARLRLPVARFRLP